MEQSEITGHLCLDVCVRETLDVPRCIKEIPFRSPLALSSLTYKVITLIVMVFMPT